MRERERECACTLKANKRSAVAFAAIRSQVAALLLELRPSLPWGRHVQVRVRAANARRRKQIQIQKQIFSTGDLLSGTITCVCMLSSFLEASNGKTLAGWPNPTSGFTQYKNTRRRHVLAYQLEPPCGPSFSACMERWPPRVCQKRQCVEAAESASDNIGKAGMVLLARERRCRHAVVACGADEEDCFILVL